MYLPDFDIKFSIILLPILCVMHLVQFQKLKVLFSRESPAESQLNFKFCFCLILRECDTILQHAMASVYAQ